MILPIPEVDVLVVEDNRIDQQLLQAYLSEYDISYQTVDNGFDAIIMLKEYSFKLILLDIGLPKMDGYDLTQAIRSELNLNIPIVAITAYEIEDIKDKCFALGMNACFSKPIGRVELVGLLTQFLPDEKSPSNDAQKYEVIDFSYLKSVCFGDKDAEKEITNKFIETIKVDLTDLNNSFKNNNIATMKRIGHRMLSTIYIMGLKPLLEEPLRSLEDNDNLSKEQVGVQLDLVNYVCNMAIADAEKFLN